MYPRLPDEHGYFIIFSSSSVDSYLQEIRNCLTQVIYIGLVVLYLLIRNCYVHGFLILFDIYDWKFVFVLQYTVLSV